jgi:hypothetical protein
MAAAKDKGRAGWHQATPKTSDSQDSTQKPDIDLQSWAALGSNAKPSRTYRNHGKPNWKRSRS